MNRNECVKTFTVLGPPFGKQRPRFTRNGHAYTPEETKIHEEEIAWSYRQQCGSFMFDRQDNIDLYIEAYFPIPKSASKEKRKKMLVGDIRPTVKPDWDNIGKLCSDALNGVAIPDDKQIVSATVRKYYSSDPRLVVAVSKCFPLLTEEEKFDFADM